VHTLGFNPTKAAPYGPASPTRPARIALGAFQSGERDLAVVSPGGRIAEAIKGLIIQVFGLRVPGLVEVVPPASEQDQFVRRAVENVPSDVIVTAVVAWDASIGRRVGGSRTDEGC
jgi:hypothetical protein